MFAFSFYLSSSWFIATWNNFKCPLVFLLDLKSWTKVQLTASEIKGNANQMESWLSSLIVVVPLSGILDSTQWFRFVGCERLRVHYESPHQSVSPAGVSRVEAEYQPRGVEWRRTLSVPSLNNTTHITFHRTKCSRWALPLSVSWILILHLL